MIAFVLSFNKLKKNTIQLNVCFIEHNMYTNFDSASESNISVFDISLFFTFPLKREGYRLEQEFSVIYLYRELPHIGGEKRKSIHLCNISFD